MQDTTIRITDTARDRLRAYKNELGLTYSEAIEDLVPVSLENVESDTSGITSGEYVNTGKIYMVKCDRVGSVCTFGRGFQLPEGIRFSSLETLDGKDVGETLDPIRQYLGIYADDREDVGLFTINQSGHGWIGQGWDNFINSLTNQEERYGAWTSERTPHHREDALYIARHDNRAAMIYGQPSTKNEAVAELSVEIMESGMPIKTEFLHMLASMPAEMSNGQRHEPAKLTIPESIHERTGPVETIVQERITNEYGEPVAAIVSNPYYEEENELYQDIRDGTDEPDEKLRGMAVSILSHYGQIWTRIQRDSEIEIGQPCIINNMTITSLPTPTSNGAVNVDVNIAKSETQ